VLCAWVIAAASLGAALAPSASSAFAPPAREVESAEGEYEFKALYVYNFLGYTTWPKGTFEKDTTPIKLLILGKDPFGKIIDATFKDVLIGKRPVSISRAKTLPEKCDANLIFCSGLSEKEQKQLFKEFGTKPVLLIGETPGFAEAGGTINLFLAETNLKFEINTDAVKSSGLTLSSQLLKLAKIVKTKKEETP
jgi:hypothetical protein